jgi:hypothetical protein
MLEGGPVLEEAVRSGEVKPSAAAPIGRAVALTGQDASRVIARVKTEKAERKSKSAVTCREALEQLIDKYGETEVKEAYNFFLGD